MAYPVLALYLSCIPLVHAHKTALCVKEPFNPNLRQPIAQTNRFKNLVERSNVFVDKTLMLEEFLAGYSVLSVISGPMSWGKTVLLDMAKMFIEIRHDPNRKKAPKRDETYHDFFRYGQITWTSKPQQLKSPPLISCNDEVFEKYHGKFPVIYLSMRNLIGHSFLEIFYKFAELVSKAFKEHHYLQDYFAQRMVHPNRSKDKQTAAYKSYTIFTYYLENQNPIKARFREGLRVLSESLNQYYLKSVFIFIDDYDTPFNSFLQKLNPGDYRKLILFFKRTYEFTFKCKAVKKALLTGMFPIDRNHTFLPYNVITEISLHTVFNKYFGFARADVEAIFQLLNIQHLSEKARQWYNGYHCGFNLTLQMYNPSSLLQFINHRQVKSYTKIRDGFDMLDTMLKIKPFRYTFEMLVNNRSILFHGRLLILDPYDFVHLRNLQQADFNYTVEPETIAKTMVYLYSAGYLTLNVVEYFRKIDLRVFSATIPNKELMYDFSYKLMDRYLDEYQITDDIIDSIVVQLAQFVVNNHTRSPQLRDCIEDLTIRLDMDLGYNDSSRIKYVTQLVASMLNFISLKLRYDQHFETHVSDEPSTPDFVLYKGEHAAAVAFRYNFDSAHNLLEEMKTYGHVFDHLPRIKTIKFVGIEINLRKEVYIRGELQNRLM